MPVSQISALIPLAFYEEKNIIAQITIKYLNNRFKNLNLDDEKQIGEGVMSNLAKKGMIADGKKQDFYVKLNDVHDVSWLEVVLKWFASILSIAITFGVTLRCDLIKKRLVSSVKDGI